MPEHDLIEFTISLYGNFVRYRTRPAERYRSVSVPRGGTVGSLLSALGIEVTDADIMMCEGERIEPDYQPSEGDDIILLTMLGGGQGIPRAGSQCYAR